MSDWNELKKFYHGKKVLVTGHTGFKGTWLTVLLSLLGAEVYGTALPAPTEPSLFELVYGKDSSKETKTGLQMKENRAVGIRESMIGDIRDFEKLHVFIEKVCPDVVIHMAAQPIVRESYRIPRETYEINVMGTVNVLESLRLPEKDGKTVSVLTVTTDKVYQNEEKPGYGYREEDRLDGYDPYSNSKSCSELVTHSYKNSFFDGSGIRVSTARAGNVIGGGDFAADRIIPDCIRAYLAGEPVCVRNPGSVRPFQHVLEPLSVYLEIAMKQYEEQSFCGYYNVGPDEEDCVTAGELCELFAGAAEGFSFLCEGEKNAPHEAGFLKLSNRKIKETFGWEPVWHIEKAVRSCACWAQAYRDGNETANREFLSQIAEYTGNRL